MESSMVDKQGKLQQQLGEEIRVSQLIEDYLKKHYQDLAGKVDHWMTKHEQDLEMKSNDLLELKVIGNIKATAPLIVVFL